MPPIYRLCGSFQYVRSFSLYCEGSNLASWTLMRWAEQAQCTQFIVMFIATARKLITVSFYNRIFVFDTYLNLTEDAQRSKINSMEAWNRSQKLRWLNTKRLLFTQLRRFVQICDSF